MNRSEIGKRLAAFARGVPKTMSKEGLDQRRTAAKRSKRLRAARRLGTHTKEEWERLLAEVKHQCVRCGNFGIKLTKDHIKRIGLGGSDAIDNIQPMCRACNSSKTNEDFNWLAHRRVKGWNGCPPQSHLGLAKK